MFSENWLSTLAWSTIMAVVQHLEPDGPKHVLVTFEKHDDREKTAISLQDADPDVEILVPLTAVYSMTLYDIQDLATFKAIIERVNRLGVEAYAIAHYVGRPIMSESVDYVVTIASREGHLSKHTYSSKSGTMYGGPQTYKIFDGLFRPE